MAKIGIFHTILRPFCAKTLTLLTFVAITCLVSHVTRLLLWFCKSKGLFKIKKGNACAWTPKYPFYYNLQQHARSTTYFMPFFYYFLLCIHTSRAFDVTLLRSKARLKALICCGVEMSVTNAVSAFLVSTMYHSVLLPNCDSFSKSSKSSMTGYWTRVQHLSFLYLSRRIDYSTVL